MKLIKKKKDCLLFFFIHAGGMSAILYDRFPFAYNQIIYVILIQFHVLLIFDHFYGLSSVFNAKVVSFIIIILIYLLC